MSGIAPIALIDEIAAHFDPRRREALFDALERLGGQAFLTGADPAAFATLAQGASYEVAGRGCTARLQAWPESEERCARDAERRQRVIVFAGEIVAEEQFRIGGADEPGVGEDLVFELARRPAGASRAPAPLRFGPFPAGDGAENVERRRKPDVVVDLHGRVAGRIVVGMQDEAAARIDGAAAQHADLVDLAGAAGSRPSPCTISSCTRSFDSRISLARWLTTMPMAPSLRWAHI